MTYKLPLCVDLDGTLIRSDSLHESFIKALNTKPIKAISSLAKLGAGKAPFKQAIADLVMLDPEYLPYNQEVLDYIKAEADEREVILVTGANTQIAEQISDYLGFFSSVIASDSEINLVGDKKREALEDKFGKNGFEYIGNEPTDRKVWSSAHRASVVTSNDKFATAIQGEFSTNRIFKTESPTLQSWVKLLRVHQWVKNLLILVPFFLDHKVSGWSELPKVALVFIAFSLLASLTYIINDMLDVEADRKNTSKRTRPLASGAIPISQAVVCIVMLSSAVLFMTLFLPLLVNLGLALYTCLTLLYSFALKKRVMLDVCVLAVLHTMRIIVGTLAIDAQWSFWLLAFSMFFFLSLAIAKRVSELMNVVKENKYAPEARGYRTSDISILNNAGISAGYISILVIALYINSAKVASIYEVPEILWLICPFLLYWVGRLWIITSRGDMNEDPIVFALRDLPSMFIFSGVAIVFSLAVLA